MNRWVEIAWSIDSSFKRFKIDTVGDGDDLFGLRAKLNKSFFCESPNGDQLARRLHRKQKSRPHARLAQPHISFADISTMAGNDDRDFQPWWRCPRRKCAAEQAWHAAAISACGEGGEQVDLHWAIHRRRICST